MAVFDYTCEACGKTSELLVHSADAQVTCPSCGSDKMQKQFSAQAAAMTRSGGAPASSCPTGGCCGGSCPGF